MKQEILIVDDEENIRFAFEIMLTEQGYDVFTSKDYHSAVSMLDKRSPDLVITDIILGGHTGIDLLSEIKKRKLNCPVIMITGEPNIETSAEAVRLGAFDYVPKPIRRETLLRIAGHALMHKALLEKKRQLEKDNLTVRKNMEAIFGSLRDGVITVDDQLKIIEANPAVGTICGMSVKNIIGRQFDTKLTQCNGACIDILTRTLQSGRGVEDVRIECGSEEPSRKVVKLTSTPLQSDGINFSGAVLVVRNVTKLVTLEKKLKERSQFHHMIGKSRRMQEIYTLVENLSDTDSTVLITGETGTGKELIANAIHHNSLRRKHPFVTVNCSALSENLLESELFGHVKGAFTGAVKDKKGRFEMAEKGTLFLDEIGDISPLVQLKLLRVLQEKEFEKVGDATPIKADVRVLAATHRDLKEKVHTGEFREDLHYRIKVVEVPLPKLMERRDDIPLLARHFLNMFNNQFKKQIKGFENQVVKTFMQYNWPGNIRELEHAVEHGFVLCQDDRIGFEHLPVELRHHVGSPPPEKKGANGITKEVILDALAKTGWNKAKAARILGIGRRTIYRKIDTFHIIPPTDEQ